MVQELSNYFAVFLIIILVKIVSWYVGLSTVSWVMDQIINWGVIAIVIIFQPEIRRGLEHLGRGTFFTHNQTANEKEEDMIKPIRPSDSVHVKAKNWCFNEYSNEDWSRRVY